MRLKDIADINARALSEQTRPDYNFTYIDIGSVDSDGNIATGEQINFGEAPSRARRIVTCNDIIVSTVRTYLKAIAFIDDKYSKDTIASTGFAVLSPHKQACPKFIYYAIRNDNVIDEITKRSIGVSYPAISTSELSTIEIDIPSLEVQQRVVSYLDAETAKIDHAIELLKKKRDAYTRLKSSVINRAVTRGLNPNVKLKDSGVNWIGMIPEGWEVKRIKDIACINKYALSEQTDKSFILSYVDISSVDSNGQITFSDPMFFGEAPSRARRIVKDEDIIISTVRTYLKAIGYIDFHKNNLIVSTGFAVLSHNIDISSRFLYYAVRSDFFVDEVCKNSIGVSYPAITASTLSSISVCIPPLSEQHAIASYLDNRCARIDKAAAIVDKQIDAYTRLKKSLINEVVTGKHHV